MRNLDTVVSECKRELDDLNIRYGDILSVRANPRARNRWGSCKCVLPGKFEISINPLLLDDSCDIIQLKTTVIHELLHTCCGCMNHGVQWKKYAEMVNSKYGYHVKRCTSPEEKGLSNEYKSTRKANYLIKCTHCSMETTRDRISNIIIHPEQYRCKLCGSKISVIPMNEIAAERLKNR